MELAWAGWRTPGGPSDSHLIQRLDLSRCGSRRFPIFCEAILPTNVFGLVVGIALGFLVAWVCFLVWKVRYTSSIRVDAVQRSQAVTVGKVQEQLVPYLPGFPYNPKDVRFLGSPVDLVVFDGLAEGRLRRVVFLEVKTGSSALSARQCWVREVIQAREVEWVELRVARPRASGVA
jgi:Endonuclease related to archaeal Holliday junction resolvase